MAPRYDCVSEDQLQRHDTAWVDERTARVWGLCPLFALPGPFRGPSAAHNWPFCCKTPRNAHGTAGQWPADAIKPQTASPTASKQASEATCCEVRSIFGCNWCENFSAALGAKSLVLCCPSPCILWWLSGCGDAVRFAACTLHG